MVDGSVQRDISIPCSQSVKNDKFQVLCVGDKLTSTKLVDYDTENANQRNVMYSLSNVKLFQKCVLDADILGSLVALGSDCISLTECQVS